MARRRAGSKSAAAFRTISEVAEELQLPQHVLRFWETKFHEVQPLKRGGGRRYYRPEDMDLLRRIRDLLYSDGYTIKDVQQFFEDGVIELPPGLPQSRKNGSHTANRDQRRTKTQETADAVSGGDRPSELDPAHRHELEQILADLTAARERLRRHLVDAGD